jgi:hypothetical protein
VNLPEYVPVEEVQRVCRELGLRDWAAMTSADVTMDEARTILAALGDVEPVPALEDFRDGLAVELEHGTMFADANVTNNHPILTAKIVMAHFKESLDYYRRLEVAEIEGDILKAVAAGGAAKVKALYGKLVAAKQSLGQAEAETLA